MKKGQKMCVLFLTLNLGMGLCTSVWAAEGHSNKTSIAYANMQMIWVGEEQVELQTYVLKDEMGNDTNYVKLRDIAYLLNGSPAQFSVEWDGCVNLKTGEPYRENGSEMSTLFSGDRAYMPFSSVTLVDGEKVDLDGIILQDDEGGAYSYYKLRDLGSALGFAVDWSPEKGIYVHGWTEEEQKAWREEVRKAKEAEEEKQAEIQKRVDAGEIVITEIGESVSTSIGATNLGTFFYSEYGVSPTVVGGDGDYEYRFQLVQNGQVKDAQDWSEKSSYRAKLNGSGGACEIQIEVRDSSGKTASETAQFGN